MFSHLNLVVCDHGDFVVIWPSFEICVFDILPATALKQKYEAVDFGVNSTNPSYYNSEILCGTNSSNMVWKYF